MAKLESRIFAEGRPEEVRHLLVVPHDEPESALIDEYLGDKVPTKIIGEVTLSDGYGQHYIRLMRDDDRQAKEITDLKAQLAKAKSEAIVKNLVPAEQLDELKDSLKDAREALEKVRVQIPELWGDHVRDGKITLELEADSIEVLEAVLGEREDKRKSTCGECTTLALCLKAFRDISESRAACEHFTDGATLEGRET